jgi:hypothetical protein
MIMDMDIATVLIHRQEEEVQVMKNPMERKELIHITIMKT